MKGYRGRNRMVSKLVFYAQSTSAVISQGKNRDGQRVVYIYTDRKRGDEIEGEIHKQTNKNKKHGE